MKKIKKEPKAITKKPKGPVKLLPLGAAAVVAAGCVVFFTFFANPFLEKKLEGALETLFEARSEIDNFHLSLLKFQVGMGGIRVADRDSPMTNLFQAGRMEFRLKPQAILRGKVYIEEIRADSLLFGTPRKTSGALPQHPAAKKPAKPQAASSAPPLVDLQNFDAQALLDREFDKLQTPGLYDQAASLYSDSAAKWQTQTTQMQQRTADIRTQAQSFVNLNVNNLRDPQQIAQLVSAVITAGNSVQEAVNDVNRVIAGVETDLNAANRLRLDAQNALTADLAHLKSYVDVGSGAALDALEPAVRDILSNTAEKYLDYGLRALEVFNKLKAAQGAKTAKTPPKERFKGRDVAFPTQEYPAFYLGILASDFTIDPWRYAVEVRGISSNPDLSGAPTGLKLSFTEPGGEQRDFAFSAAADFRSSAETLYDGTFTAANIPVRFTGSLEQLGIEAFSGNTAASLGFTGARNGAVIGAGNVTVRQAQLENPQGTIAQAVSEAVRQTGEVSVAFEYRHNPAAQDAFSVETNMVSLAADALKRIAAQYADRAAAELERVLRERVTSYIDGKFVSAADLENLGRLARGDKTALEGLKGSLDKKRAELEQQAKDAAQQKVQEAIQDKVPEPAQNAVKGLLEGAGRKLF
jgi:uncharacterized protein (TIGR03545 family)